MFTYPLISGNPDHVLSPGTVSISASAAKKYFDQKNPIGKTLKVTGWVNGTYRVTGVFQDVPANSHLQFDVLLPIADLLQKSYKDPIDAWNWTNFITYVQLRSDANPVAVEQKCTGVLNSHLAKVFGQSDARAAFQPLSNIHLNGKIVAPKAVMESYWTVYFFLIIGLVTLLIALVNYINLTTARVLNRAREVGIRKAIGAQKSQLSVQFLCESALTILVASTLALFLTDLLRPMVGNFTQTAFINSIWSHLAFWAVFLAIILIATLIAGLYPAFILSSFKPSRVLKSKTGTSTGTSLWLRRGLVVFQFTAAITLLAGTAIVYSQLYYMRNMDLGINLEHIITIPSPPTARRNKTPRGWGTGLYHGSYRAW